MEKLSVVNDRVLLYDDITCVLVNLGSAIRMAKDGHGLEHIEHAYEQLRNFRANKNYSALEVACAYNEYLKQLAYYK